jgi:flagellar biosynthesis/type III secretory pathway protein FliH
VTKSEDFLSLFDTYAMYECTQLQAQEVQACQEIVQTVIPVATQIVERYTICQKLEYCQRKWRFWV